MARDVTKQQFLWPAVGGYYVDTGYVDFTTTGETVEIYTKLSKIFSVTLHAVSAFTNAVEHLYLDETVSGSGIAVSGGSVTLTRVAQKFAFTYPAGMNIDGTSYDLLDVALFTAPCAMVLESAVWVNGTTAWTGSPVLCVGTSEDGNPDDLINDQAVTITAFATTAITTLASTAIASGADVRAITTGGTTTKPIEASLTINTKAALTSGLQVWYEFKGLD